MSVNLEQVLSQVRNLGVSELLTIQETITQELRRKTDPTQPVPDPTPTVEAGATSAPRRIHLPHAYRRTPEEIEASLAAIFTPEELAQIGTTDFSKLPIGPKSASEMLNEDREDRF